MSERVELELLWTLARERLAEALRAVVDDPYLDGDAWKTADWRYWADTKEDFDRLRASRWKAWCSMRGWASLLRDVELAVLRLAEVGRPSSLGGVYETPAKAKGIFDEEGDDGSDWCEGLDLAGVADADGPGR